MVDWFDLSISIAEILIIQLFISFYLGWKYEGHIKNIYFIAFLIVSVITIEILNSFYINEGFFSMIFTLIYFIYALIALNGDIYTKLFIAQFANSIAYFTAAISILGFSLFVPVSAQALYTTNELKVWLSISSKILLIIVFWVLLKFKAKSIRHNTYMKLLTFLPVVTEVAMIGVMNVFLSHGAISNDLLLSTISVMLANVLTFYAFIKISKDMKKESEMQIMKQKYEDDKRFAEEIEELYSKTCGLRHDILNHMEIISRLIKTDGEKALEYVDSIVHNQLGQMKFFIKTDNECFDAIANAKLAICEKLSIKVQVRVMNNALCRLKNDEIGVVFGNLFDNAIEATKNTKEKRIELDVQKQGKRCLIIMMNSIDNPVLLYNAKLNTTKKYKQYHGYGLKNVNRVVESYGGMIDFFEEDDCFGCNILV